MKVPPNYIPVPYHHKPTGQARVMLNRHSVVLGVFGSPEAQKRYDEAIRLWLGGGRSWNGWTDPATLTISHTRERYLAWAHTYYRKEGRTTSSVDRLRAGLELLTHAKLDKLPLRAFGPKALKRFQVYLMSPKDRRWGRTTINRYTDAVVQMVKWAVSEQLCPPSLYDALKAVPHVRKGQVAKPGAKPVRESRRIQAAPEDLIETAKPHLSPKARAMLELQLLTGMRPLEVVHMRSDQISPSQQPDVWIYRPAGEGNKLDHLDGDGREVFLGPRAYAIVKEHMPPEPSWHVFHFVPGKKSTRPPGGPAYDVASYRRAITRACDAAHPHPALVCPAGMRDGDWVRTLSAADRAELEAWRKPFRFSPVQLRHAAATYIANHEKLHIAQLILGHKRIQTTMGYVHVTNEQAAKAARRLG